MSDKEQRLEAALNTPPIFPEHRPDYGAILTSEAMFAAGWRAALNYIKDTLRRVER